MHRKRLCILIPLISTSFMLVGCASYASSSNQNHMHPVPQALIEAAQHADQMRMVYADIQARSNGHTVESVRLDASDASAPAFMRSTVRLDYDGPMQTVLERLAKDMGYRLNEYSKPASGLSWTPWIRLSGNKSLLDHMREMNSQVPWHIVLDHRNKRLVIDYSDDAGMANQIRSTQERRESQTSSLSSLPDVSSVNQRTSAAIAQTLSNSPPGPVAEAPSQTAPSEVWYTAVQGYEDRDNAREMVVWLAQHYITSYVQPIKDDFEVRVVAANSQDAFKLREHLMSLGVPSQIGYEKSEDNAELKRRAEEAMVNGWPAINAEPTSSDESNSYVATSEEPERQWVVQDGSNGNSSSTSGVQNNQLILSGNALSSATSQWSIQVLQGKNMDAFSRHVRALEAKGLTAGLISVGNNLYQLRVTGLATRSDARHALPTVHSLGHRDAYIVRPQGS